MDKFSVFLERVENKSSARETMLTYKDGLLTLSSRMWHERAVSPDWLYNGHAEVKFLLNRENTKKFFQAIGCGPTPTAKEVLAIVEKDFMGDPCEGHFFDNLASKIEGIVDRTSKGIQRESFYQRAATENALPDYRKLPNPSHKFEVFCLSNGIDYIIKENGNGDYYAE
jgi:hypothetical protein